MQFLFNISTINVKNQFDVTKMLTNFARILPLDQTNIDIFFRHSRAFLITFACSIFFGLRVFSTMVHQRSILIDSGLHKPFKIRIFISVLLLFNYWPRLLLNTSYINTRGSFFYPRYSQFSLIRV